jgi:hypothetical protein
VHPFWSSHEDKRACVRLSMGGQPWSELELHGQPGGARWRGEKVGRRRGEGVQVGDGMGAARGAMGRGC